MTQNDAETANPLVVVAAHSPTLPTEKVTECVLTGGNEVWLDNDMTTNLRQQPNSNWITGTVDGLAVQAKCYSEPSEYGLELDGRISKLWVATRVGPDGICLFNYDRGHDIDHLKPEALQMIVAAVGAAIK